MIGSHDDGEITFYEELGVAPNASPEDIRDAFRLFVRLLHPDQQTDPQLKEIAENQMRKLNRVYAVLSDAESRRRYDEVLDGDFLPQIVFSPPSPGVKRWGAKLAWVAAIGVSAGLLLWLASDNTPGVLSRGTDAGVAPVSTPISAPASPTGLAAYQEPAALQISRLRSDLRAAIVERDAAIRELNKVRGTPQMPLPGNTRPPEEIEPRATVTLTELPSAPKLPVLANATLPRIERPGNRKVSGFWFYAKPSDGQKNKNEALYPPEYIEATITEDGGVIRGRYRARFQIVDRAISPDVNFTFSGAPNGSQINCLWTGAGGAKGELTLKLTSENSLRVDWTASELGSEQGLSSGTAVLTRRIE